MPIEVIVTPICTAEMYSLMLSSWLERQRRALGAFVAHHFQARAARAHERVLGDHEERVDRDQHGREDELQRRSRARRRSRGAASARPRPRSGGDGVAQVARRGHATSGKFFVVVHRVADPPTVARAHRSEAAAGAGRAGSGEPVDLRRPARSRPR